MDFPVRQLGCEKCLELFVPAEHVNEVCEKWLESNITSADTDYRLVLKHTHMYTHLWIEAFALSYLKLAEKSLLPKV